MQLAGEYEKWYEHNAPKHLQRTKLTYDEYKSLAWRRPIRETYPIEDDREWEDLQLVITKYVSRLSIADQWLWYFRYSMGFFEQVEPLRYLLGVWFPRRNRFSEMVTQKRFSLVLPGLMAPKGSQRTPLREMAMHDVLEGFEADAFRPKLNGLLFVRNEEGTELVGPWSIPYTGDIESVEFYGMFLYVIRPLNFHREMKIGPHVVKIHEWRAEFCPSEEGVVLLKNGEEYRLKRNPTTEVRVENGRWGGLPIVGCSDYSNGVAEICNSPKGYMFRRWRPECLPNSNPSEYFKKTPRLTMYTCCVRAKTVEYSEFLDGYVGDVFFIKMDTSKRAVEKFADPNKNMFRPKVPRGLYEFFLSKQKYSNEAMYQNSRFLLPEELSGEALNEWVYKKLSVDIIEQMKKGAHLVVDVQSGIAHSVTVKMLFESDYGIATVSEGMKKLSLPGGRVEVGESPWSSLVREVQEELGCDISVNNNQYLGLSLSTYGSVVHLFRVYGWLKDLSRCIWIRPSDVPSPFIGWLPLPHIGLTRPRWLEPPSPSFGTAFKVWEQQHHLKVREYRPKERYKESVNSPVFRVSGTDPPT